MRSYHNFAQFACSAHNLRNMFRQIIRLIILYSFRTSIAIMIKSSPYSVITFYYMVSHVAPCVTANLCGVRSSLNLLRFVSRLFAFLNILGLHLGSLLGPFGSKMAVWTRGGKMEKTGLQVIPGNPQS